MARTRRREYRYAPIPGAGAGMVALTIHPPGTFFGGQDYAVFVGGCGVGNASDLPGAKRLLLRAARAYCHRRIEEARRIEAHFQKELARLRLTSLLD